MLAVMWSKESVTGSSSGMGRRVAKRIPEMTFLKEEPRDWPS